jgi:hypothetical protein
MIDPGISSEVVKQFAAVRLATLTRKRVDRFASVSPLLITYGDQPVGGGQLVGVGGRVSVSVSVGFSGVVVRVLVKIVLGVKVADAARVGVGEPTSVVGVGMTGALFSARERDNPPNNSPTDTSAIKIPRRTGPKFFICDSLPVFPPEPASTG